MKLVKIYFITILGLFIFWTEASAQEISINMNRREMPVNKIFQITVSVKNGRIKQIGDFPNIKGLEKRGRQTGFTQEITNGQSVSYDQITQNYVALRQGDVVIPTFTMMVNGNQVRARGRTLKVTAPQQRQQSNNPFDFFDQLMGGGNSNQNQSPQNIQEVKADAFVDVSINKNEIYVGEGVTATFAFYLDARNRAELHWDKLNEQVEEAIKNMKQTNTWEESYNIRTLTPEYVTINNKVYNKYEIVKTTYFPLNDDDLVFRPVTWNMLQVDRVRNRSFYLGPGKQKTVTFKSKKKVVKVKKLPPHPLRDKVIVGEFYLDEKIDKLAGKTGQSLNYQAKIYGKGNISNVNAFTPKKTSDFDFYPPKLKQNITRSTKNNIIAGSSDFQFFVIPNEPGSYDFGDYFEWIYFDPKKEVYDTLRSEIQLKIRGESKQNKEISSNDLGGFYDSIDATENQMISLENDQSWKLFTGIFLVLILVFSAILLFRD